MTGDGQITPDLASLLCKPEGATELELARVAGNWIEQVEWLMISGQVEKVSDGELRFRFTEGARGKKKTWTVGEMLERLKGVEVCGINKKRAAI